MNVPDELVIETALYLDFRSCENLAKTSNIMYNLLTSEIFYKQKLLRYFPDDVKLMKELYKIKCNEVNRNFKYAIEHDNIKSMIEMLKYNIDKNIKCSIPTHSIFSGTSTLKFKYPLDVIFRDIYTAGEARGLDLVFKNAELFINFGMKKIHKNTIIYLGHFRHENIKKMWEYILSNKNIEVVDNY